MFLVKAMVFPILMYGYEGWTIKKAKCWRSDAFELWCWRKLLSVSSARGSNQSILKQIRPEYSLEELMLILKLQYVGHVMQRTDSLKTLMLGRLKAGGEGDDREWDCWMASLTRWAQVWVGSGSWCWTGNPRVLKSMGSQGVGHNWETELRIDVETMEGQSGSSSTALGQILGPCSRDTYYNVFKFCKMSAFFIPVKDHMRLH